MIKANWRQNERCDVESGKSASMHSAQPNRAEIAMRSLFRVVFNKLGVQAFDSGAKALNKIYEQNWKFAMVKCKETLKKLICIFIQNAHFVITFV